MLRLSNEKKNIISALLLQIVTILHGLILPRLIIVYFGSEINGLVGSITQFLSFISLLEGGLGAVVLAELYKPIKEKDYNKIRVILGACQSFFNKLAIVFIIYTIILALFYPLFISRQFGFVYTSSLVIILSFSTLGQYLFSITNKLFLQASQKVYIVNIVTSVTIITNLVISVIILLFFPSIHLVKIFASLIFLIQPIVFNKYVDIKYRSRTENDKIDNTKVLRNRWSGFAQNLAHFINMNTDIAVLTIFVGLSEVSVYSVFMLAINALRTIICQVANSYHTSIGKHIAEGDIEKLRAKFQKFESSFWIISTVLFCCCLCLINQFVQIYTSGVEDANYYRPLFGYIMVLANCIYCIREPYRLLILADGKFKETNFGSIVEAALNLVISIALVIPLGLTGVAIGTLIAIGFRMVYFIWFIRNNIVMFPYRHYIGYVFTFVSVVLINLLFCFKFQLQISNFFWFILYGAVFVLAESGITILCYKAFDTLFGKLIKDNDLP